MGTAFATGQVAGAVAALAVQEKPGYAALRAARIDHGVIL